MSRFLWWNSSAFHIVFVIHTLRATPLDGPVSMPDSVITVICLIDSFLLLERNFLCGELAPGRKHGRNIWQRWGGRTEGQVELVRIVLIGDFKNNTLEICKWSLLVEGQLCWCIWGILFLKLKPYLIRGRRKWEENKGFGFWVRQSWTWVQPPLFIRCMTQSPEPQFPLLENGIIMASTSCCCCWWWWCWLWWWWPFQFSRTAMTKYHRPKWLKQ